MRRRGMSESANVMIRKAIVVNLNHNVVAINKLDINKHMPNLEYIGNSDISLAFVFSMSIGSKIKKALERDKKTKEDVTEIVFCNSVFDYLCYRKERQ